MSFEILPPEIIWECLLFLNTVEIQKIRFTSKKIFFVTENDNFWKEYCQSKSIKLILKYFKIVHQKIDPKKQRRAISQYDVIGQDDDEISLKDKEAVEDEGEFVYAKKIENGECGWVAAGWIRWLYNWNEIRDFNLYENYLNKKMWMNKVQVIEMMKNAVVKYVNNCYGNTVLPKYFYEGLEKDDEDGIFKRIFLMYGRKT